MTIIIDTFDELVMFLLDIHSIPLIITSLLLTSVCT